MPNYYQATKRDHRKHEPRADDFFVEVEGVGKFRFNRKTYGAQIRVDAEISRILGPQGSQDRTMNGHALLVGNYKALMVDCPPGWEDIESIDLTENPKIEDKIYEVFYYLREKLDSFRRRTGADAAGEAAGQGDVPNTGSVDSPVLPDAANGSTVPGDDPGGRGG